MVLFATRPNLFLLALGTTFACRFLCLLVPPRYLLLELGERCVRCRSSGSGLVSLLRHLTCTPRRSLRWLSHTTNARAIHRAVETALSLYRAHVTRPAHPAVIACESGALRDRRACAHRAWVPAGRLPVWHGLTEP